MNATICRPKFRIGGPPIKARYVTAFPNYYAEGWPSPYCFHAMRSDSLSRQCPTAGLRSAFAHEVLVRPTGFRGPDLLSLTQSAIPAVVRRAANAETRNNLICADVLAAVETGRFPLVLTERTEKSSKVGEKLSRIPHVITLQGGMLRKTNPKRPWLRLSNA